MRTVALLLLSFLVIALSTGFSQTTQAQAENAETVKVRRVVEGIITAIILVICRAFFLPHNDAPVVGKKKTKPRYEALFASYRPVIKAAIDEVIVAQDGAFVRGYNAGRLIPRSGGEPRVLSDVLMMILRRAKEAGWEIARLMWHPAPAPKNEMKHGVK